MTYHGRIQGGAVLLDPEVDLPEGTRVRIEVDSARQDGSAPLDVERVLKSLPADANLKDVLERVLLLYRVSEGIEQLDAGQGISHEEARQRFSEWLK